MTAHHRPGRQSRIGVVDDHPSIVAGLRVMFDGHSDLQFAAGAATVAELLTVSRDLDLVVLDLRLEDDSTPRSNVATLDALNIPVIAFTSGEEAFLVRQAAGAGVRAVLRKNVEDAVLLDACRAVLSGEETPTVDWAAAVDADENFVDLSPQLRRVLELFAAGESTDGVAAAMHLSPQTVKDYVGRIRAKYTAVGRPAPSRQHLVLRAIEDGWLPIPRRLRRPR